ncbi:hypothetical protein I1A62_22755 [Rhodococcus sp. USK10]|uniref:Zn-ribbon domain-containing OB-fold protein n=1 Tax=Rhodococcus TaxID=1827 RepID=UPI000F56A2E1|nr:MULTISPECIES: zinc ribbon domain-containing protein [Rhodococcus]QYB07099.1 hypothetical protein I1A62_22755 [Rhodococcus sp. USK10]
MSKSTGFEIDDVLTVTYSYGYGGISPFFESLKEKTGTFKVTRCKTCQLSFCPPRIHCQKCWDATEWDEHTGEGVIESVVWAYWMPIDSPARAYTDLPYAYAAIRLDGCVNLIRVRVEGLDQRQSIESSTGRRGRLSTIDNPTARLGDLKFVVDPEPV